MKTSFIHMKIAKNLKESAQAKAKAESTTLTAVITRMLVEWTKPSQKPETSECYKCHQQVYSHDNGYACQCGAVHFSNSAMQKLNQ